MQYDPLPTAADCSVVAINAALLQLGENARHVSSDVYVSTAWSGEDIQALDSALKKAGSLANRVRRQVGLEPYEWFVECCGDRVGSNPGVVVS